MRKGAKDGRTFIAGALPLSCTLALGVRLQSHQFFAMVDPAIVRPKSILFLDPSLDLIARSNATVHLSLLTGSRPLFPRPRFDSWFAFLITLPVAAHAITQARAYLPIADYNNAFRRRPAIPLRLDDTCPPLS